MKTVTEVSKVSGVSVRTLHHYDAIGLLKPSRVTEAGYRLYDTQALKRLQTILLFRQLQFPLKQIREILDAPGFDPAEALTQQIQLLRLQKEHLEELIAFAEELQKSGGKHMSFKAFDNSKLEAYAAEAKERWGKTEAYREYEEKSKGQSQARQRDAGEGLMEIFRELGQIRHLPPEDAQAQALVAKLRAYITEHFYTCTPQILKGLGMLYIAGDAMTDNINAAGGEGTADFAHKAIEAYVKQC